VKKTISAQEWSKLNRPLVRQNGKIVTLLKKDSFLPTAPRKILMWTSKRSKQLALSHAQLESVILERTAELQTLSQRLLKVQDEERRKISRDLHDSTGQTLAALKISITLLQEECQGDPAKLRLAQQIGGFADHAINEIRTMSYLLHPPLLDEVGFTCAAEWFVEGFAKRSGIDVAVQFANSRARLPKRMEIALFRVLQESLTNVHRHSGALKAAVRYAREPKAVTLEIQDFGRGIPEERLARLRSAGGDAGVGLAGMRERMRELCGRLEIESGRGGTLMRAVVPLFAMAGSLLNGELNGGSGSGELFGDVA
jgi:signal transduction histidine kinase